MFPEELFVFLINKGSESLPIFFSLETQNFTLCHDAFCSGVGGPWLSPVAQFKRIASDLCPTVTHGLVHPRHKYL